MSVPLKDFGNSSIVYPNFLKPVSSGNWVIKTLHRNSTLKWRIETEDWDDAPNSINWEYISTFSAGHESAVLMRPGR